MISGNVPIPDPEPDEHWYILKVQIGSEQEVQKELQKFVYTRVFPGLFDVLVPTEASGDENSSRKLLYPGYIIVQCYLSEPVSEMLLNHPQVKEFALLERCDEGSKPTPKMMDPADVRRIRESD